MDVSVNLDFMGQLPDMKSGSTPRYILAVHYNSKDALILPGTLVPGAFKPIARRSGEAGGDECPCISFADDAVARFSFTPEEILDSMGLQGKLSPIKSLMHVYPATIDTICTRLINVHMAVDLLVVVPASSISFLAAKKAPPAKGQPADETEYICIPVSHAVIDMSEHVIKALSSSSPMQFLHPITFTLRNALLGMFGDILALDAEPPGDLLVDACMSVTVSVSDFILRKTINGSPMSTDSVPQQKTFTVGTMQFHTANFPGLYSVPGAYWTMEMAIPVELDDDGKPTTAVYCLCGGGVIKHPASGVNSGAVAGTGTGAATGGAGGAGAKKEIEITSEQVKERLEQIVGSVTTYMPVNTDSSLSKSDLSGALSANHTDVGSRHSFSTREGGADRDHGLTFRFGAKLSEQLQTRDISATPDNVSKIVLPDYMPERQFQNLVDYALYVDGVLSTYSNLITKRIEEHMSRNGDPSTSVLEDPKAGRPSSRGVAQSKDAATGRAAGQGTATGITVRFAAEVFEPFILGARNLVMSRSFLLCINDRTRALLQKNYTAKNSRPFLINVLLRPEYALQPKYFAASQAIRTEKKPPTAPMVPITTTHSLLSGNAQAMNAFCAPNSSVYGFNRSILYYTQAPDQYYNKLPCAYSQLQQSRPDFGTLPATYCFTQVDLSPMLNPVCQYASCDCTHPIYPYDEAVFAYLFPSVIASWSGVADREAAEGSPDNTLDEGAKSEEGSDVRSASQSRPGSAGFDGPTQIRGKANKQGGGSGAAGAGAPVAGIAAKPGAQDKGAKGSSQNPVLAEYLGKAARYTGGEPNYIFGNMFCGIYVLLDSIANMILLPIKGPALDSPYISTLISTYCNNMLTGSVVLDTLETLQKLAVMPTLFNNALRSSLLLPVIGISVAFRYPLLANISSPAIGGSLSTHIAAEDGDSQWPNSLRLIRNRGGKLQSSPMPHVYSSDVCGDISDEVHQSKSSQSNMNKQHLLAYTTTHSMAKERQKTMRSIKTLIDNWREDITARYKQVSKPMKVDVTQNSRTTISYSDIPEENAKMKAIVQAGRQLALRGFQGQILTQNALVAPSILPQISALLSEEKTEVQNEYSINNFKLLIQNEGFVEVLSRRILLQLESLAHKGFNNLNDMLEYLLLNIVEGGPLDLEEPEEPKVKEYKIQRRIDKDDDDDNLSSLLPTNHPGQQKIGLSLKYKESSDRHRESSVGSEKVRVVGDSMSILFPDASDEERNSLTHIITSHSTSVDTSLVDGMNSLMIPQHVSLKDITSFLFKAKFLAILGTQDCLDLSFKLSSATLARQAQLLSNDRRIDIFSKDNIMRISKLVDKSNFRVMMSTMLISGARLSAPHVVKTSADFERLANFMRGPVSILCACLDNEHSLKLLGTDSCIMALSIIKTLFKSGVSTLNIAEQSSKKDQGQGQNKTPGQNKKGLLLIPYGYDYSEQLLVNALLSYDNFMKFMITKVAGDNVEEVHVWTKNDSQAAVLAKLRERKYNKDDVNSMMEILQITPLRNYYSKQFNDLLEGEVNTTVVKLQKDNTKTAAFPSNESTTGSIAGSVAISLYDRHPRRCTGDDASEVGSMLRRNIAGMTATASVMSGMSGFAGEKKSKTISPELQAELDEMPFYNIPGDGTYTYPPFWVMGAYMFVLWSMKLMDARYIARALQTSFRKYIETKQEEYKDEMYFQEHGKRRKTMQAFEDEEICSDVGTDKSSDTTVSVDAEIVGGLPNPNSTFSASTAAMSVYGATDAYRSPSSLSRLSFGDLKNYKALKMQKSNFTKQVSINHYSAIQEYLKTDTIDGGLFAPLPYRFSSNEVFMEHVLDSTLPENDKFVNPGDPASKNIMRLCAFLSLAEWLSVRGETIISTFAASLADHLLKGMISAGQAMPDSPFFMHQQIRGIVVSLRNMLYEKKNAAALEFSDAVIRGSLGPCLVSKAKACPGFLYLRARAITGVNLALLMNASDPTKKSGASPAESIGLSSIQATDSVRVLLNETSRITIQAYQLASRSRQGGRDDFFRGSTSTYDSYLSAEFLYTTSLILFSSINVVEVIKTIYTPMGAKKKGAGEKDDAKMDLMFTEVPKPQDTLEAEDDHNMETLTDFTSLLRLPEAAYTKRPYDITSDATSTQMLYMREQYNKSKIMKVQSLKDSKEPVKMSVNMLRDLKKRAKETVVDAVTSEMITGDSRNPSPGQGGMVATSNIACIMQNKLSDSSMNLDNTLAALANATLSNRTVTTERSQKDITRALILTASALKNLIIKYPHVGQAWASFSLTQLAMGNIVESRLSSSIATLLAPEAIESWISWVCCELQELHGIKCANGTINPARVTEIRGYMKQIEAMGINYTLLRVIWADILEFGTEVLK